MEISIYHSWLVVVAGKAVVVHRQTGSWGHSLFMEVGVGESTTALYLARRSTKSALNGYKAYKK
jgi:hypothetical protein